MAVTEWSRALLDVMFEEVDLSFRHHDSVPSTGHKPSVWRKKRHAVIIRTVDREVDNKQLRIVLHGIAVTGVRDALNVLVSGSYLAGEPVREVRRRYHLSDVRKSNPGLAREAKLRMGTSSVPHRHAYTEVNNRLETANNGVPRCIISFPHRTDMVVETRTEYQVQFPISAIVCVAPTTAQLRRRACYQRVSNAHTLLA